MSSVPHLSLEERLAQVGRDLRQELSEGQELSGGFFCRMGKLFVEELLKAEVGEALGRDKGQRREQGRPGYRNGYKSRSLLTGEGEVEVDVPQVRGYAVGGQEQAYRSAIWQGLTAEGRRSMSLEKVVAEMYARGLSTRDVEDALRGISEDGQTPLLSRSSVSRVTEVLWGQFEAFTKRDLSGFDVVYLCVPVRRRRPREPEAAGRVQPGAARCSQAVLVTWGILRDGSKVLLHMSGRAEP